MFSESMDYDEFASKTLLQLNNHMRKKGVEFSCINSGKACKDKCGRMITKKYVLCSQAIIPKKLKLEKLESISE